jgi:hypothetical protein
MADKQTLVSLTQGFIKILTEAKGQDVDLVSVEKRLNTQKRRLYDVVNVLSGCGLIERTGKARVKWVAQECSSGGVRSEVSEKEREIDRLMAKADSDLEDILSSELFERFGWIDQDDADQCEPEMSVSLYSLRGPPSMSVKTSDGEHGDRCLLCKVEDRQEGQIQLSAIRAIL